MFIDVALGIVIGGITLFLLFLSFVAYTKRDELEDKEKWMRLLFWAVVFFIASTKFLM